MTRDEINKEVLAIFREVSPTDSARMSDKLSDLYLDSLDMMEATTKLERTFGIDIPDRKMRDIYNRTVEGVADYCEYRIRERVWK